ncbi:MAG TPA: DUF177 domain-containing protein [Pyrinomonadaceae bacterium]|nr:DUF177 domain-containing protein [Pyrinomonadaceae bacterium]
MRIELDRLQETGDRFAHAYEPDELVLDEEHARLTEPPEVTGRVQASGREVRLRGRITARAEVDCDRCLKSVAVPVETEFDVTYVPEEDYGEGGAAELQEEDMSLSVFDGETIDVDELVREQLLLALPSRALCTEECKGLCPVCGADRNAAACGCETEEVDPRWAGLLKAVKSDE